MNCLFNMDNKDLRIIECLREHGRWSIQKIAKQTRIPITTVYHRMKRLEKERVIQRYSVQLDYIKMGLPLAAYVLMTVDYKGLKQINLTQYDLIKKLLEEKEVESCSMVTGGTDIILKMRVANVDELNEFITVKLRNVDGIEKTQTMIILNEVEKHSLNR